MKLTGDKCQCTACGEHFNSTYAFDRHRTGEYDHQGSRRCLSVAEMTEIGFSKTARGYWIRTRMPVSSVPEWQTSGDHAPP